MANLSITVEEKFRTDLDSDDVRRVHPNLPETPFGRLQYLRACDWEAYESIRDKYPNFSPPGYVKTLLRSSPKSQPKVKFARYFTKLRVLM